MHHAIGGLAIIALIAFAFGQRTAQACVGVALIVGALGCLYVGFLIVTNQI